MRFRTRVWVLLIIYIGLCGSLLYSNEKAGTFAFDFVRLTTSVAADSMGQAMTAQSGLGSFHENPAGIAVETSPQLYAHYLNYFQSISYQNLEYNMPVNHGSMVFSYSLLDFGEDTRTTFTDRSGDTGQRFKNTASQIDIGYARLLNRSQVGMVFSVMNQTLDAHVASGLGLSFGYQYQYSQLLSFGSSIRNLTLKKIKFSKDEAELPQEFRLGVMTHQTLFQKPLTLAVDIVNPADHSVYMSLGSSYELFHTLSLRSGYSGYGSLGHWSLGLGLKLNPLKIDFSYKPHPFFGPTYRLGLGVSL